MYNRIVAATIEKRQENRESQTRAPSQSQVFRQESIEVSTVDKFQGQERDVVILNLCCLHDSQDEKKSQLLDDWRRLYVAFSRSRHKLVVIGSRLEFEKYPELKRFLQFVEKENVLDIR